MPLRLTAIAAAGILALLYLSPLQVVAFLCLYLPCDLFLVFALRRLSQQPQSVLRLCLVQIGAFLNMSTYLVLALMLWQEPGLTPKLGVSLFVFGGMLSIMLVRTAFLPMTVANSLPLAGLVVVIAIIEHEMTEWHEQVFLLVSVLLLAGYFTLTLRSALQINRALGEAHDAALARVATQRRFLATMSHELRTPLNGILGMAQQLVSSHPGIGGEVIRDSARDMAQMVGDLLDNAAIEAGALRISKVPVNIYDMLRRINDRWQPAFEAKGLTLSVSVDKGVPAGLVLDPLRVMQCLSNLLANALRHTREGGARLEIKMHGPMLVVVVTDSGPGLPADSESQLFQPFVALASDLLDSGPSTGLGLYICHGIARAMGGDLRFERPTEGGSQFYLSLPTTVSAAAGQFMDVSGNQPVEQAHGPVPALSAVLKGKRALTVDDIATNRLVMKLALKRLGIVAEDAASGHQALQMLASATDQPFDLILMDIRMPGLSGFETLGLIRHRGFTGAVIAVSADAAPAEQAEALACGFDGYLTKPVELERLTAILSEVMAQVGKQAGKAVGNQSG